MIFQKLFHQIPFNVAVIDRNYDVVEANDNLTGYFGDWRNRKCHTVNKKLEKQYKDCHSAEVLKKGEAIIAVGVDQCCRTIICHHDSHSNA